MILAQFKLWIPSVYLMSHELRKGKKASNNSYFTSLARNTHPLTNKPGAESWLSYPPRSISAPFSGDLKLRKATRKGKKSKEGYEVILGNRNRDVLAPQQKGLRVIATVFKLSFESIVWEKTANISRRYHWFPPRNDDWETRAEIPYWWRVTAQIWVVLLIGWSKFSTNQKHCSDWVTKASSVSNFCARSSEVISRVWCRLFSQAIWTSLAK